MSLKADEIYLRAALRLAQKGFNHTAPNPLVGAVIVKNNKIIARGWHHQVGQAHAEIDALKNAQSDVVGATLYVNLEPCAHFGRTPPCVDALIKAGIKKVVCCTLDPNPLTGGQGVKKLRQAGIKVEVGLLKKEARELNRQFFFCHQNKRPFIAIKFASSLDGRIATRIGDSRWITNAKARAHARSLRAQFQAILVGVNTVIKDNPHLGIRRRGYRDPLRIILDPHLKIPLGSKVLRDNNALVVVAKNFDINKKNQLAKRGIEVLEMPAAKFSISQLLKKLYQKEIISILVEGGGETSGGFADARAVDQIYAFYAPLIIGGREAVGSVLGRGAAQISQALRLSLRLPVFFGDNFLIVAAPRRENSLLKKSSLPS